MVRAMARALSIAIATCALGGAAFASPKSAARRSHAQANNMPAGFTWPPSKAMVAAGKTCEAHLDELGIGWQAAKAQGHVVDPITLADFTLGGIKYTALYDKSGNSPTRSAAAGGAEVSDKHAPVMDCQLALGLAQVGQVLFDLGVREVRFGSIYRWSKVRVGGKTKNMLSRHALGLAMDVVSFVDDTGREAVVGKDYKAGDELLHAIERTIDATPGFRGVLTPQNDPISHKDHFHIEANPDYRN